MPSDIKIGVIGAGYWGPKLIRNFNEIPGAHVSRVADLRDDRLAHVRKLYPGTQTTKDYRELLDDPTIHGIAVATPVSTHYCFAREAILAGKHVLVEKPLTASSREAKTLIELAAARHVQLMVGHTFEYNPAVEYLKQLIVNGTLGQIYYINATRVNLGIFQQDINVVWDLAPHDISILLFLLEMMPETVSARGGAYVQAGIHDVAYVTLNFPNGVLADIRVSWLDPQKQRQITVVGSRKMVVYDDVDPNEKIRIFDKGVEVPPYSDTMEEFRLSYRYGDIITPHIALKEPLRVECEHFLQVIAEGRRARSDGYVGLRVVQILEAAQRSLLNSGHCEPVYTDVRSAAT